MKSLKRLASAILIALTFGLIFCSSAYASSEADTNAQQDKSAIEKAFWAEMQNQISSFDTSEFDRAFRDVAQDVRKIWGEKSMRSMLSDMMTGESPVDAQRTYSSFIKIINNSIKKQMGTVAGLLGLSIVGGVIAQLRHSHGNGSGEMAGFACYAMAMILALAVISDTIWMVRDTIKSTASIMELSFPPLMVLLAASGATASAGIMQPTTAMLSVTMTNLITNFLMPIIFAMVVLSVIGNISQNISLTRMQSLLASTAKWSIGGICTLYLGVASVQGITAKTYDGVSLRAARFALDKFVPYVGSLMSGSVDAFMGCSSIMKNAVGICAVLLMIATVIGPLIQIVATQLAIKASAALCEPLGDTKLAKGLDEMASVMSYMFAITAAQGLMFIFTIALIIGTGVYWI